MLQPAQTAQSAQPRLRLPACNVKMVTLWTTALVLLVIPNTRTVICAIQQPALNAKMVTIYITTHATFAVFSSQDAFFAITQLAHPARQVTFLMLLTELVLLASPLTPVA